MDTELNHTIMVHLEFQYKFQKGDQILEGSMKF